MSQSHKLDEGIPPLGERTGRLEELGEGFIAEKGDERWRVFICYDPEYPEDEYICTELFNGHEFIDTSHEAYHKGMLKEKMERFMKEGYKIRRVKCPAICYHWI